MNSYRLFLLLAVVLELVSCSQNTQEGDYIFDLVDDGELRLPLDSTTSNISLYMQPFIDNVSGKELLVYMNRDKPSLLFFDIENSRMYKEIVFHDRYGPDGVGRPYGACAVSMDSIFILSKTYEVILVNGSAKTQRKYRLLKENEQYNENTGLIVPDAVSLPYFNEGENGDRYLYFVVSPDRFPYNKTYYEAHTSSCLNVNTGQYVYFGSYPSAMKGKIWGVRGPKHSRAISPNGEFVSSFAVHDSLVVWRFGSEKKMTYYAGTRYRKSYTKPFENPDESRDLSGYALQTIYYEGLSYDPYRQVYYRLACLPVEIKDEDGNMNDIFNKPISVIILDKEFNIIGETRLADNTYRVFMFFVGKEGLFIAKTNPHNPTLEEDYLVFTRFKLVKR